MSNRSAGSSRQLFGIGNRMDDVCHQSRRGPESSQQSFKLIFLGSDLHIDTTADSSLA